MGSTGSRNRPGQRYKGLGASSEFVNVRWILQVPIEDLKCQLTWLVIANDFPSPYTTFFSFAHFPSWDRNHIDALHYLTQRYCLKYLAHFLRYPQTLSLFFYHNLKYKGYTIKYNNIQFHLTNCCNCLKSANISRTMAELDFLSSLYAEKRLSYRFYLYKNHWF